MNSNNLLLGILVFFFLCITSVYATDYDFNEDNKSDILWRNGSTNHLWKMNEDGSHTYKNIGLKSSTYAMKGIVDFNADGMADILWRKRSTNHIWYMHVDGTHTYKNIGSKSIEYRVQATGDFNADGIADIFWRKGSSNYLWYMHADGSHTYKKITSKPEIYMVVGSGDFNGDGIADIFWRKGSTNHIWYMHADGTHTYKNVGSKPSEYSPKLIADFNADGISDIFWRRGKYNYIWYMNSDGTHTYKKIANKPVSYKVVGSGDINSDGIEDIVWRNGSTNHIWKMHKEGNHTYINIGQKSKKYHTLSTDAILSYSKNDFVDFVNDMDEVTLKSTLNECVNDPLVRSNFVIGHRGATKKYPEHTKESYETAALLGAGMVECDVTFTKDKELVCRHSQCDLHQTTDILLHPDLLSKCSKPFKPAEFDDLGNILTKASAECCTSDITLKEFKTLSGKNIKYNTKAKNIQNYVKVDQSNALPYGTLMSHKESIELFKSLGVRMIPEIKTILKTVPDFSEEEYVKKIVDEYKQANISPDDVFIQTRNLNYVHILQQYSPLYTQQSIYSDQSIFTYDENLTLLVGDNMKNLADNDIQYLAAAIWTLLSLDENNSIVPSAYAKLAQKHGLKIIAWTYEKKSSLKHISTGGGWYYRSIHSAIHKKGDLLKVLDILYKDVGIVGIFTDGVANATYYHNCISLDQ